MRPNLYDRVAEFLGVPREEVKVRVYALAYSALRVRPYDNALAGFLGMPLWPDNKE
jgi:hypothetical protein